MHYIKECVGLLCVIHCVQDDFRHLLDDCFRMNEDELRRFYAVSEGDFARFLSSVKKTIRWRQKYTLLSPQELESWVNLVFWHGSDVMQRPCLIIRVGIAGSDLASRGQSQFVRAVGM